MIISSGTVQPPTYNHDQSAPSPMRREGSAEATNQEEHSGIQ
jgi:hypothetical protein